MNSELLAQIDTITISHNRERENLLLTTRQERNSLKEEISRLRRTLDEEVLRRKEMEKIQSAAAQNVDIQFQKSFKENLPTRFEKLFKEIKSNFNLFASMSLF